MIQSVIDQGYFDIRMPEVQKELKKVMGNFASISAIGGMVISLVLCGVFGTLITFGIICVISYYFFKPKKG